MRAKDYLMQIKRLENLIQNKAEEIYLMKSKTTPSSYSFDGDIKVQSSHVPDYMGEVVAGYVDEEEKLQKRISSYMEKRREIISTIEELPTTEYDILHKIYVQGYNLGEISAIYDRSYSWATTLHSRALKDLQKILDERKDAA